MASPCPICETRPAAAGYRPFCSKRCADVDLSRWLKGSYAIPGASADETEEAPPRPEDSEG
ncbi:MAG: DNA gyrase inhibitor YacG [Pseudomonadota bacterium]